MKISDIANSVLREVQTERLLKKQATQEVREEAKIRSALGKRIKKLATLIKHVKADKTVSVEDLERFISKYGN